MTTATRVRPRRYRLRPWLIRSLIPARQMGSYVLYRRGSAVYTGRSDTDLRRRLLAHAASARAEYFTFDVHHSPITAYAAECLFFHVLEPPMDNQVHPSSPSGGLARCPYCAPTVQLTRRSRQWQENVR